MLVVSVVVAGSVVARWAPPTAGVSIVQPTKFGGEVMAQGWRRDGLILQSDARVSLGGCGCDVISPSLCALQDGKLWWATCMVRWRRPCAGWFR
eukprot:335341-Pyramimonas_sp.AAC.1